MEPKQSPLSHTPFAQLHQLYALCEAGLITSASIDQQGRLLDGGSELWRFFGVQTCKPAIKQIQDLLSGKEKEQFDQLLKQSDLKNHPASLSATLRIPCEQEYKEFACQMMLLWPSSSLEGHRISKKWQPFPLRLIQSPGITLYIAAAPVSQTLETEQIQTHKLTNIGALAAGIAHDLNNLATGALTFTSLLQERLKDQQNLNYVHLIQKTFERATQLSQRVLAILRDDDGCLGATNPVTCVRDVSTIVKRTLPDGIELTVALPSKQHPVDIGFTELTQITLNLLINARDAVKPDGVIRVRGSYDAQPKPKFFVLKVLDDGSGIHKEDFEKIFAPLFTTKGADEGTGLGLSIVKQLVEGAGGSVSLQSEPGKGSCFTIQIPVWEAPAK